MASASVIFDIVGRDRASDKFDKVGKSADSSGGKLEKFGKVAKVAALGLAAGVGAAAVGLFKLTQGAAEDAAGQARLAKALQNATGATKAQVSGVEDWISKQGVALGVADDQLRPALEKLAVATGDVGKAQKLASLAMDVSAGTGMSLEMVSKALAKAQNGQVSGLTRLGISTKDAEGKTISFREATRRLADAHKGQAATSANTLQGKMGRLKLILSETGETIGAKLIPFVTKLADWFLRKGLPAISRFGDYLSTKLPPIFEKVRGVVSKVMGALQGDIGGKMGEIKGIFRDAISIVSSLWRAFGPTLVATIGPVFSAIKAIIGGAFTVIKGIFRTVAAVLKGDWRGAWNGIKTILRGAVKILGGVVRGLWALLKSSFKVGVIAVKAIFRAGWDGIKTLAKNGATAVVDGIKAMPGKLLLVGGKLLEAGKTLGGKIMTGLKNGITGVASVVGDIATAAMDKLKDLINTAIDKINGAIPNSLGKGPLTIDLPDNPIPRLARGGPVRKGQPYIVGDRGPRHAWELFVPDEDGRVEPHVPSAGSGRAMAAAGMGGGVTIVFKTTVQTGVGDPKAITKEVERTLREGARILGRPLQIPVAP